MIASAGDERREQTTGLCENCNNRNDCIYFDSRGFVWHCNEYQVEGGQPSITLSPAQMSEDPAESGDREADGAVLRGLCINCEKRLDCCFPKPDSGVWHCEEYV
ncbi:hypothetical protein ACFL51_01220 [Myxococcota bacterium]